MKTLFIDCQMGAAGDMLTAALAELTQNKEKFMERLNSLGIPQVEFTAQPSVKCGITGTHVTVTVDGVEESEELHHHHHHHEHEHEHHHQHEHHHEHHHHHTSLHDITHIVEHLNVSDRVKADVMAVYKIIAEAESQVHGKEVDQIHFHEVGSMDAVADITAVCLLMEELDPDEVVASPVHVGSGSVRCAHGILPVPAPATELILRDIPIYSTPLQGELCTPTGAALLRHFVDRFDSMPVMKVTKAGYGMGRKDFPQANCVRALLGETRDKTSGLTELSCNLDDMTPEDISYACKELFSKGAREVFTTAVGMKKNRPGTLITVICDDEKKQELLGVIFRHTTTIGVREKTIVRHVLDRREEELETTMGKVHRKLSTGFGVRRVKYEHDDLEAVAKAQDMSIYEVRKELEKYD